MVFHIVNGSFRRCLETVDGMMFGKNYQIQPANKNYYVGWSLSTIDADGNIDDYSTCSICSVQKCYTKSGYKRNNISNAKYKLYFNSENSVFGNSGGKNICPRNMQLVVTLTNNSIIQIA